MVPLFAIFVLNAARAVRELGEAGIGAMNLTYKRAVPWRKEPIEEPIFRGYVFARIEPGQFEKAAKCEHVAYVVSDHTGPLHIPEEDFTPILMMALTGKLDEAPRKVGAPVKKAVVRSRRRKATQRLKKWTSGKHAGWYVAAGNVTRKAA